MKFSIFKKKEEQKERKEEKKEGGVFRYKKIKELMKYGTIDIALNEDELAFLYDWERVLLKTGLANFRRSRIHLKV